MVKLTAKLVLARARAADLESVKKLNCWGSELTDVSVFRQMPNIEVISLSVNNITTLQDFRFCQNLQELYVRKNCIAELSEICYLKSLPKLRVLWLADNPCETADKDKYKMTVLKTLPNLQKLDNTIVTPEDVNRAIEAGEDLKLPEKEKEVLLENGGGRSSSPADQDSDPQQSAIAVTLEETNKIREQLGLKPLPAEKYTPIQTRAVPSTSKHRNANILSAVLALVKELDHESLETVQHAVKHRLDSF
ncbi:cilia- and flagella-associated protein 410-like isoform X4 [Branchiostoma floridae]|uniref:Cilia- and flagella-associated protein 410 n=1 Tax=Branchiostoma floridae TaxID=7739 RepID=A0A9J7HFA7_BRAFL|nr:cilia- and flagella-associated protein 410-like isoform X1 [Branchiostoma floridae]XP_035658600.1 cilia- and flagella-associated protein 410-like isoform X2 [Branchiostoma floridae]XP_035658601.1 cilia- and flagella-associated protein 410-like isoform X3 [Branchiostoma floridae]XP_035658602.1 cilia- and flagella-associated protein 410-like isoform X4 [Branchiostoma floridae]